MRTVAHKEHRYQFIVDLESGQSGQKMFLDFAEFLEVVGRIVAQFGIL